MKRDGDPLARLYAHASRIGIPAPFSEHQHAYLDASYERENAIGEISHRQSLRDCRPIKSTSPRSERCDTRASTATINRKHRRDD